MQNHHARRNAKSTLLAAVFLVTCVRAYGQTPSTNSTPAPATAQTPGEPAANDSISPTTATPNPSAKTATTKGSNYQPDRFAGRAQTYYATVWGVASLSVKWTGSGEVIRFSYRVLDGEKAKTLNDKKYEPELLDAQAHVKLVVPSLEKVGKLRQSSTPEAGKMYWMAFSNKGRPVKKGDHVDVVIGQFHAQGLVVD